MRSLGTSGIRHILSFSKLARKVITTIRFFFESPIFTLTESGMSELSALKQEDFFPCPFRLCIENLEPCNTC